MPIFYRLCKSYGVWAFVLFSILLSAFIYAPSHIVISSPQWSCVWKADSFLLKWRHSVEKQYWQEHYQKHEQKLRLTHIYVQSFGAGVPTLGEVIPAPQGYVGFKSDVLMPELNWVVSRNMQGEILTKHSKFPINQLVDDYSTINIKIVKQPYIKWLWIEQCNDHSNTK